MDVGRQRAGVRGPDAPADRVAGLGPGHVVQRRAGVVVADRDGAGADLVARVLCRRAERHRRRRASSGRRAPRPPASTEGPSACSPCPVPFIDLRAGASRRESSSVVPAWIPRSMDDPRHEGIRAQQTRGVPVRPDGVTSLSFTIGAPGARQHPPQVGASANIPRRGVTSGTGASFDDGSPGESYIDQMICPVTSAIATACARVCAPSLFIAFWACVLIVSVDTHRRSAMSSPWPPCGDQRHDLALALGQTAAGARGDLHRRPRRVAIGGVPPHGRMRPLPTR